MATKKAPATSPSDVSEALDRAQMVSTYLTQATERLNKVIKEMEAELTKLNLGVTAAVEVEREDAPEVGDEHVKMLRFGKDNREWKLLWESGLGGDPDSWGSTPLLNTSREIRMRAVSVLPLLIRKLVDTADKQIADVNATADEVEKLLETVKSGIPF